MEDMTELLTKKQLYVIAVVKNILSETQFFPGPVSTTTGLSYLRNSLSAFCERHRAESHSYSLIKSDVFITSPGPILQRTCAFGSRKAEDSAGERHLVAVILLFLISKAS